MAKKREATLTFTAEIDGLGHVTKDFRKLAYVGYTPDESYAELGEAFLRKLIIGDKIEVTITLRNNE